MTIEEKIKQIVNKAIANGWKEGKEHIKRGVMGMSKAALFSHEFAKAFWKDDVYKTSYGKLSCINKACGRYNSEMNIDAEYHKNEWLDDIDGIKYCPYCAKLLKNETVVHEYNNWQSNLSEMVLEKDYIKFLEEYL